MTNDPLNIFNELKELDCRNKDFYSDLSQENKKKIGMFPIMRWASGVQSRDVEMQEYYILATNEVNKMFFDLGKHPELQWKMLSTIGVGTSVRHQWIPMMKKKTTNKLDKLLYDYNPFLNDHELKIIKSKITVDDIKDVCKQYGMEDAEIKEYIKEVKKLSE